MDRPERARAQAPCRSRRERLRRGNFVITRITPLPARLPAMVKRCRSSLQPITWPSRRPIGSPPSGCHSSPVISGGVSQRAKSARSRPLDLGCIACPRGRSDRSLASKSPFSHRRIALIISTLFVDEFNSLFQALPPTLTAFFRLSLQTCHGLDQSRLHLGP